MGSLKEKVSFYLTDQTTPLGKAVEFFLLAVNLAACTLYVIITYQSPNQLPLTLFILESAVVIIFSVEYILRLGAAPHKIRHVVSFYAVVDLLSILPIFFGIHTSGFLRSFRVLRVLRFTRFLETETFFFGRLTALQLQVVRVLFTMFTIIFIAAGFIHHAEAGQPGSLIETFADAFYFAIVTLSTVGFGDITPTTELGRWFTVVMIVSGIVLIPWQARRLVQLFLTADTEKRELSCPGCGLDRHDPEALYCKLCGAKLVRNRKQR